MSTPGWYDDPRVPGQSRWWDGQTWTTQVRPGSPAPYSPYALLQPDPSRDLAEVVSSGRSARIAMVVMACVSVVTMLVMAVVLPEYAQLLKAFFTDFQSPPVYDDQFTALAVPTWVTVLQLVSYLASFVQVGARIFEVLWIYRATTFVRRAGHRTQLSPGWAAAGYFVPVVSLWFPYLAVRDILGTPTAPRRVGWWWATNLAAAPIVLISFPVAFASFWAGAALLALAAVPTAVAPLLLRGIIRDSAEIHARLVPPPR
jgi:hypothetical protein